MFFFIANGKLKRMDVKEKLVYEVILLSIILASASPRRKELLSILKLDFKIDKSDIAENMEWDRDPSTLAMSLAFQKGLDVYQRHSQEDVIISADTIVVLDNKVLGKPSNEDEAYEMLRSLSGRTHRVITGISLIGKGKKIVDFESTIVKMKELSDDEIYGYIRTKEPMDKAGSYGIQGMGGLFVESIIGDYFNIVGLPVKKLSEYLIEEFGIKIF